jgi:pimeloyl-ACP methyl ester carboxylesterase
MAAHALAFLDTLGLERVDLLGCSLGGMVAQEIALARPSLVRKMLLVGNAPKGGEEIMHLENPKLKQIFDSNLRASQRLVKLFFAPSASSQAADRDENLESSGDLRRRMRRRSLMNFKTADVSGVRIFYREAGDLSKPNIVLLHGFPSSSYSFHDLIPRLADRFHVIAPDYPGMGYSEAPAPTVLRPTFDEMVMTIDAFIAQCAPGPVILYMHDIGGPIGMRIATAHPDRIAGLIFQNFTISIEGWNPERLKVYERLGGPETPENLAEIEQFATVERDMFLHKRGARRPDDLNPDYWAIDAHTFSIPASRIFMSRLFMTLATNIELYPQWTAYLKDRQPKTLIVWGRNDPLILPAAAEFVKQIVPTADLRYFDGGHFVLDEYADAIAEAIIETFSPIAGMRN